MLLSEPLIADLSSLVDYSLENGLHRSVPEINFRYVRLWILEDDHIGKLLKIKFSPNETPTTNLCVRDLII